jgi:hypothetical protein
MNMVYQFAYFKLLLSRILKHHPCTVFELLKFVARCNFCLQLFMVFPVALYFIFDYCNWVSSLLQLLKVATTLNFNNPFEFSLPVSVLYSYVGFFSEFMVNILLLFFPSSFFFYSLHSPFLE